MRYILVRDGTRLVLNPLYRAKRYEVGYLIQGPGLVRIVTSDVEGAISTEDARYFKTIGCAIDPDCLLFEQPRLAVAVFDWNCDEELQGLLSNFSEFHGERGIDVGCGYGRLFLRLSRLGFSLDGIDSSVLAIKHLNASLTSYPNCRAFSCRIEEFRCPGAYRFGFAAMNTLRYLQTKVALRTHLSCMADNIKHSGIYMFCISIVQDPTRDYSIQWNFFFDNEVHQITWAHSEYCFVREQFVEVVTIRRCSDLAVIHKEYQLQANYNSQFLRNLFIEISHEWSLEGVFDLHFVRANSWMDLEGSFWFKLRKI